MFAKSAFAIAAALVAGTAGLAAPAFAASDDVRTVTVDYKDLDVHSAAGQKTLSHRVVAASDRVCAQADDSLQTKGRVQACKIAAQAQARDALAQAGVPAI